MTSTRNQSIGEQQTTRLLLPGTQRKHQDPDVDQDVTADITQPIVSPLLFSLIRIVPSLYLPAPIAASQPEAHLRWFSLRCGDLFKILLCFLDQISDL